MSMLAYKNSSGTSSYFALPDGAIAAFFADQINPTTGRIPNIAAAAGDTSQNILRAPRGRFTDSTYWVGNATKTDGLTDSVTGKTTAGSATGTGGQFLQYVTITLPSGKNGTYTVCLGGVRRVGGSDQLFKITAGGSSSPTKTATLTPTNMYFTVTLSTGAQTILPINAVDASTAFAVAFDWIAIVPGTTITYVEPESAGHLQLGKHAFDSLTPVTNNIIGVSGTGGIGLVQLPAELTLTAFTVIAIGRQTGNSNNWQPIFQETRTNGLRANMSVAATPKFEVGATTQLCSDDALANGLNLYSRGWKAVGYALDATSCDVSLNGVPFMNTNSASPATFYVKDFWTFCYISPGSTGNTDFYSLMMWPRKLTNAEVKAAVWHAYNRAAHFGITLSLNDDFLIHEVDSISTFNGFGVGTGWTQRYASAKTKNWVDSCWAENGGCLTAANAVAIGTAAGNSFEDRAAKRRGLVTGSPAAGHSTVTVTLLAGTNDLHQTSMTAAQYQTAYAADIQAEIAAGNQVVACTITNNSTTAPGGVPTQTKIDTFNTWLKANYVSLGCVGLIDFAQDTLTLVDGVHPNDAGHATMETRAAAVLDAL